MNSANRTDFEIETEQYLQQNNIYGLFHKLTEQLVIEKPADPLGFILGLLEQPTCSLLFTASRADRRPCRPWIRHRPKDRIAGCRDKWKII